MIDHFEKQVRLIIYDTILKTGQGPTPADIAMLMQVDVNVIDAAFQTLHDHHLIFLDLNSRQVIMAWPLSGIETPYAIDMGNDTIFANCAWDLLGIPAMLHTDMNLSGQCLSSGETIHITIEDGQCFADGVVHFLVPPRDWYADLIHT